MRLTVLLLGAMALASCGTLDSLGSAASGPFSGAGGLRGSQTEIGGVRFRTRVTPATADGRGFATATRGEGRNMAAALEAGRAEAVAYCLRTFGGSEIAWSQGPDRAPEQVAVDETGAVLLAGTCISR
ncbi:hypothetical protein [Jannaschia rubra]|uniref:Lipoprotein n=1 Tax=Jannaschia rubra TaxID=282197 RepID=A0A0M6XR02_9RHOB|nr:hypothetical protein [Jannaschia rubra]CTQ33576.1 hypothetical protein JAN5088_02358 [Jannaschia rubra]SFG04211.1 hypothetical protein SAMN04488517_102405 [Jannaschia rubra]